LVQTKGRPFWLSPLMEIWPGDYLRARHPKVTPLRLAPALLDQAMTKTAAYLSRLKSFMALTPLANVIKPFSAYLRPLRHSLSHSSRHYANGGVNYGKKVLQH
jgi:hypothetical protein